MVRHLGYWAALGLCLLLPACGGNSNGSAGSGSGGGGGGDGGSLAGGTPPVINGTPQGAWSGNNSRGDALDMLLLEDGSFYAMFRADVPGSAPALSFAQGGYRVAADTFTATGTQYSANPRVNGSLRGTLLSGPSGATLSGDAINSGGAVTGQYQVQTVSAVDPNYDYNRRANLADIAGSWSTAYFLHETSSFLLSIDLQTGVVAASNLGCAINGSVTPRSSNKNIFEVHLQFGQSPCTLANTSYSGVALSYVRNNQQQLTAALLDDSSKTTATMLFAQR